MEQKARLAIEAHIERIVQATNFINFKKIMPDGCPCNKPGSRLCHQLPEDELNCLFCYCPEYQREREEGGCGITNPRGKWFFNDALPKGKIWDCSDCDYPQRPETVRNYLRVILEDGSRSVKREA
ncbi:MAG: cysteine-rich small domain-containing protein [bacterium]